MSLSRADHSLITQWWFTVDRVLLTAIFVLIAIGLVVTLAASPSVALNKGLPAFYFVHRHLVFSAIAIALMLALSLHSPAAVRRTALLLYVAAIAAMIAVHYVGVEANGARRWLRIAGLSLQPSEIAKPAFVVLAAWAFAESRKRRDMPALPIAVALYVVFVGLLVMQPDIGQSVLVTLVWGALFLLAGLSLLWIALLGIASVAGMITAYWALPYVRGRIDQFISPVVDPTSQVGQAYKSFAAGGFFGRGPGEGTIKLSLPDAHTDFIFAVIAEEYGIAACLALLALFAFIVLRALTRAIHERDLATRYAVTGLALLFGFQALINMAVNVGLLPAKGMTLPMISAGGSSMLGISITLGMLLALSRRRPRPAGLEMPSFPSAHDNLQPLGRQT